MSRFLSLLQPNPTTAESEPDGRDEENEENEKSPAPAPSPDGFPRQTRFPRDADEPETDPSDELGDAAARSAIAAATVSPTQRVPSGCFGPVACGVLGICGRPTCLADHERADFAEAIDAANAPTNSHPVPEWTR